MNNEDYPTSQDEAFASESALHLKQKIEKKKFRLRKLKLILLGLFVTVLLLVGVTAYSQYRLHKLAQEEMGSPNGAIPQTGTDIVKALSRHILLPPGTPQIAEIQDVSRLKETQAFFKDAENGDIVVVYDTAIFIYRPGQDIVVAAGDISGAGQINP